MPVLQPESLSKQLRIRNGFEVKLLCNTGKILQFLNKTTQFKNTNSLLSTKYSPKQLMSRHNEQEYKIKIYVKNIKKYYVVFETGSGAEYETK
jgi:hypothetical protein